MLFRTAVCNKVFGHTLFGFRFFSTKKFSHYQVLGVDRNANQKQIKEAYIKKVKQHHPDLTLEKADDKILMINAAYEVLKDSNARAAYDRQLDYGNYQNPYYARQTTQASRTATPQNTSNTPFQFRYEPEFRKRKERMNLRTANSLTFPSHFQIKEQSTPSDITNATRLTFSVWHYDPKDTRLIWSLGGLVEEFVSDKTGSVITYWFRDDKKYIGRGCKLDGKFRLDVEDARGARIASVIQSSSSPQLGFIPEVKKKYDLLDGKGQTIAHCLEWDLKFYSTLRFIGTSGEELGIISRSLNQASHIWNAEIFSLSIDPAIFVFLTANRTVKARRSGELDLLFQFSKRLPGIWDQFVFDLTEWVKNPLK